jgi:hypothetical protein
MNSKETTNRAKTAKKRRSSFSLLFSRPGFFLPFFSAKSFRVIRPYGQAVIRGYLL